MKLFELVETPHYPSFDLKITLKPTYRCNHECWFCQEYDNSSREWAKEECDYVIERLSEVPKDKHKIWIYFYGGEPTLSEHWEYLHYKLVQVFCDRYLFIQTQTNMSIDGDRLNRFLVNINNLKQDNHIIDICSSYHLNKQSVEEFKCKMDICNSHNSLGLCFFNTDYLNEDQFIQEFTYLTGHYPEKIKLRFTEIGQGIDEKEAAKLYPKQGDIKSFEYRYFISKYPNFRMYFEEGFYFYVDDDIMNFCEISANDIHKTFRFMKCECGTRNIVIGHDLKCYHCNDDFKNGRGMVDLSSINFCEYFSTPLYCMNGTCYDGLEFKKWR